MKIFVTGGAGFIGSHLVDRLIEQGHKVIVYDNFSSGFKSNCNLQAVVVNKDIVAEASPWTIPVPDMIYHLAEYIPNVEGHVIKHSVNNPLDQLKTCVAGMINVCEAAIRMQPMPTVVLTSTAAVYGEECRMCLEVPISPYGAAKLSAEQYLHMYHRLYGLPYKIVRFFNVYGPRQRKYLMFDVLAKLAKSANSVLELLGTGYEQRDYIYIDDALTQLLAAPLNCTTDIGTGIGVTTSEVVNLICKLRGVTPQIKYKGQWSGNINYLVCQYKRPVNTRLLDGVQEVIKWFDANY